MEYTPRYLVMVTADANHNKVYRMIPKGDSWTAEYGRVGSSYQTRAYSRAEWDKKYNEKISKGYVDQTDLVADLIQVQKPAAKSEYRPIKNTIVATIVDRLQNMARQTVAANYNVSADRVTQAMVDEAQNLINLLLNITNIQDFNHKLLELFAVIPRKMSEVSSYMASRDTDFSRIIQREQDLLDVMRGQIVQKITEPAMNSNVQLQDNQTVLEALGLIIEECNVGDVALIKRQLGSCADKFANAWKVTNLKTQKRFDEFVQSNNITDTKLLFHGSRNENWWSIINTGLVLRPTNVVITGKMFGMGTYFAPKAQKSLGYTSLAGSYWTHGHSNCGFMALMDVAYGKPYNIYTHAPSHSQLTYEKLQSVCPGANCVHAHAGQSLRNDEIIIYKEEQCTIKYLVELK